MEADIIRYRNLFFSGIGGSGMSAIAQVLSSRGYRISGSDRKRDRGESPAMFDKLASQGIRLYRQDGSGVNAGLEAVVVSAAVEEDTPDYRRARELGVPLIKRADLLTELVNRHRGVCFAGTSGKSTATALCAWVLTELGYSPSFIGGAAAVNYLGGPTTGNALGGKSELYCVESDESDGSLTGYRPAVGAILNIERDHHELDRLLPIFAVFAGAVRERLILNADCPNIARLDLIGVSAPLTRFGIHSGAVELKAESIFLNPLGSRFKVGESALESPLPGQYNIYNVLAALAACEALGVERKEFARLLPEFRGVARRFQVVGRAAGVTVIDDFAHNPAKLAAVLSAFEAWKELRRKIVVFQPHGYGPTRFYFNELVETFAGTLKTGDLLILPEIYYAGGTAAKDISSRDLAEKISGAGRKALYFERRADAVPLIAQEAAPGDVVLVAGARDDSLSDFCREILAALRKKENPAA